MTSVKKYKIPYGGALIGRAEEQAIMRVVKKNWWPLAEEGKKMELEAARFLNVKHGILANSGSSAGLLALSALELPAGSEVIIPAVTFPTIFNIIIQCNLVPVVVDCAIGTYNIDIDKLESAIGPNTKAIIAVHAVGNPCDMPRIMEIAERHNLFVIEDNCDGWGSEIYVSHHDGTKQPKKVGSFGHLSFTSYHAAHIVAMGQGGGVFTNDDELARKVRMYRDWGRQSDLTSRMNKKWSDLPRDYDARFIYEKLGFNLSPLELQAAMGRVQLKKTKIIRRKRYTNFSYLYKHLSKYPDLIMPEALPNAVISWFSFPISTKGPRGPLVAFLEERGIETRSMFAGNILKHPGYKDVSHRVGNELSGADYILEHSFWVSVHPRMTTADRRYMIKAFRDYYAGTPASYAYRVDE